MAQKDWPDILKFIGSTLFSLLCIVIIVYGIGAGHAALPGPPYVHYLILIGCVVLLAYLEGLQVAILALENVPPEVFREEYPRAFALHTMVNEGKNVQYAFNALAWSNAVNSGGFWSGGNSL